MEISNEIKFDDPKVQETYKKQKPKANLHIERKKDVQRTYKKSHHNSDVEIWSNENNYVNLNVDLLVCFSFPHNFILFCQNISINSKTKSIDLLFSISFDDVNKNEWIKL